MCSSWNDLRYEISIGSHIDTENNIYLEWNIETTCSKYWTLETHRPKSLDISISCRNAGSFLLHSHHAHLLHSASCLMVRIRNEEEEGIYFFRTICELWNSHEGLRGFCVRILNFGLFWLDLDKLDQLA